MRIRLIGVTRPPKRSIAPCSKSGTRIGSGPQMITIIAVITVPAPRVVMSSACDPAGRKRIAVRSTRTDTTAQTMAQIGRTTMRGSPSASALTAT